MFGSVGSNWHLNSDAEPFPSPYCDYASTVMPTSIREAMTWSEYITGANGIYASLPRRVISYFLTSLSISGKGIGSAEKDKYLDYFEKVQHWRLLLQLVGQDYMCLHGDTRAVTRNGVFRLRDLVGQTVEVLSEGGVYRTAEFKSFGRQELLEVSLSDGRKILATPEHQWVARNCSGKLVRVPTTSLVKGYSIERTVAPRPDKNEDYQEGVRHGFVFGDGSLYNDGRQAVANFFGPKDQALLPYFHGHGSPPREYPEQGLRKVHGLPARYKKLPANDSSASYWYGFVCGFLAADGSVDTHGCALLTQKSAETLRVVAEQLPRIGMAAGPLRGHWREASLNRPNGCEDHYEGDMHYLTLLKRFMQPEDFLVQSHREKFTAQEANSEYGRFIGVRSVEQTGVVDEVFCCTEMQTHTFVVDNGVLTGNCYGNTFNTLLVPFRRFLGCPNKGCGHERPFIKIAEQAERYHYRWTGFEFLATCPSCKYTGAWHRRDRVERDAKKLRVKRWNPKQIDIAESPSGKCKIKWRIPEKDREQIKRGLPHVLEDTPWEIIECVRDNTDLVFDPRYLFHWKNEYLAGVDMNGWGMPPSVPHFRQAWYVQVLHRANEAIGMDYIVPARVISPAPSRGSDQEMGDLLANMNANGVMRIVERMLRQTRRDPGRWHFSPIPLQYSIFGGDAKLLGTSELLDQGIATLLNMYGYPVEFYKMSLQTQVAPVAARLMAALWVSLVEGLVAFAQWLGDSTADAMLWEKVDVGLEKPEIVDNGQQDPTLRMGVAGQGMIGPTDALKPLGIDFRPAFERKLDDERWMQERQAEQQQQADQAAALEPLTPSPLQQMMSGALQTAGVAPPPQAPAGQAGAPAGPPQAPAGPAGAAAMGMAVATPTGPNSRPTPQESLAKAQTMADQLMRMPEGQRQSAMTKLKAQDPLIHPVVKQMVEDIHYQMKQQGGQQLRQQTYGAL